MLDFLPERLKKAVLHINLDRLYELRIRAGKPLMINFGGEFLYLGEFGIGRESEALRPTSEEVEKTLFAASGYSLYAVENELRQGFLTGKYGERIGIAGSYVYEGGKVHTIGEVTSLCVRIPHEIRGCAEEIYRSCLKEELCSLLLLAPPGEGKTTLLRDLCRLVSGRKKVNILVSDERGELSAGELGDTSDCIKFADKLTAFTAGIRAMRPELIVTDELLPEDYPAVRRAREAGLNVFASAHLNSLEDVPEKIFDRYIFLNGLGRVQKITDKGGEICG